MKRRIFAVIAVLLFVSLFSLSAFALDDDYKDKIKATKVPVWANGIGEAVTVGEDYDDYGGIPFRNIDTQFREFVNYQHTSTGVYYTIKFEFSSEDPWEYFFIPYDTEFTHVIASATVVNNGIYSSELTSSDLNIETSLGHFDGAAYFNFIFPIYGWGMSHYTYRPSSTQKFLRFDITALSTGVVYLQFNVSFADSDISGVMSADYGTMWSVLSNIVDDPGISAVGSFTGDLLELTWIYKLVLCSFILILVSLLANALISL